MARTALSLVLSVYLMLAIGHCGVRLNWCLVPWRQRYQESYDLLRTVVASAGLLIWLSTAKRNPATLSTTETGSLSFH